MRQFPFVIAALLLLSSANAGEGALTGRPGGIILPAGDCARCGAGLLNLCDREECFALDQCQYIPGFLGGRCIPVLRPERHGCEDCGAGWGICTERRCKLLGEDCRYSGRFIGGKCWDCTSLRPCGYTTQWQCKEDPCGFGCVWEGSCVKKEPCGNGVCEPGEGERCPACESLHCPLMPCQLGSCPQDCPPQRECPDLYEPVCGSDGKTYPNECYALRNGVDVVADWPCEDTLPPPTPVPPPLPPPPPVTPLPVPPPDLVGNDTSIAAARQACTADAEMECASLAGSYLSGTARCTSDGSAYDVSGCERASSAETVKPAVRDSRYVFARCNDGTPYDFAVELSSSGSKDWVIHLQGGGFCDDDANSCFMRRQETPLLTTSMPRQKDRQLIPFPQNGGIFNKDPAENPLFNDANRVYAHYCSSEGWSGFTAQRRPVEGFPDGWYFSGALNVKGTVQILKERYGLDDADLETRVIFSGGSAGGAGVMANAHRVALLLPKTAKAGRLKLINDAGFAPDFEHPDYHPGDSSNSLREVFAASYTFWGSSLNPLCERAMAAQGESLGLCMMAAIGYEYLTDPLPAGLGLPVLVQAPTQDSSVMKSIMGIDPEVDPEAAQLWRETMLRDFSDIERVFSNGDHLYHTILKRDGTTAGWDMGPNATHTFQKVVERFFLDNAAERVIYGNGGTPTVTLESLELAAASAIVVVRNLSYGAEAKQVLDLCRPANLSAKAPGIILIHGGGGDKSDFMRSCKLLAASGYVAATINYREEPAPAYPMLLDDARLALAWLRSRPAVDPAMMGAMGGSAGGYLSSHLGTREDTEKVQCAVNNFGPTDWSDPAVGGTPAMYERFTTKLFGNVTAEDDPQLYQDASPITHVSSDDADFVFTRSINEKLVPKSQAERMIAALRAVGKVVPDLYEFNGTGSGHALLMTPQEMLRLWRFQKGFLDRCLS